MERIHTELSPVRGVPQWAEYELISLAEGNGIL
jgi:hypothetical protein